MAITNPNLMSGFDTNGTNVIEPSSSQQTDGYTINEVPLSANHAYMFKQWYANIQYLKKNGLYQWDASLSYNEGSFIMYDKVLYQSKLNANSNNIPNGGDRSKWIPLTSDINSYVEKTTPVDADVFVGADSADTFALKKFTWANLKATMSNTFISIAGFAISTGTNGYIKLPTALGGLIIQWGHSVIPAPVSGTVFVITYPIAFPNGTLNANAQIYNGSTGVGISGNSNFLVRQPLSNTTLTIQRQNHSNIDTFRDALWFAIGH